MKLRHQFQVSISYCMDCNKDFPKAKSGTACPDCGSPLHGYTKRSKYGVDTTAKGKANRTVDGMLFASKKEARYYMELKLRVKAGEVIRFLRQTPFHLPAGKKYIADFQEFHTDGTVHFIDVKGFDTKVGKIKRQFVEDLYDPIKIEEV